MTTEQAFLDAIRADPDDDTPRLVFADWLDEHGDADARARAELMRVQCELARWVPDLRRRTQLQRRERELIAQHGPRWLFPQGGPGTRARLERGLVRFSGAEADLV